MRKNYSNSVAKGRFPQEVMDQRMALIHPQLDYAGFDEADIIIEAAFESMAVKKQLFAEIDKVAEARLRARHQHLHARHRRNRLRHLAPARW